MKKTVKITLRKVFYKEVEVTLGGDSFEGKTEEQIANELIDGEGIPFDDAIEGMFEHEELHEGKLDDEDDRYDIFDENGLHISGGHL